MHLSLIIPLYNEEKNLEKRLEGFYSYLFKQGFEFEIILVNDGSTDRTQAAAENLAAGSPNIKLVSYKQNIGKGHAVRTGLLAGSGDYLAFVDADNSSPIENLAPAMSMLQAGYDLVIGSRSSNDAPGAGQAVPQAFYKRLLGIAGNRLIRLATGLSIRDTQCGFKAFTQKFVRTHLPKTTSQRWTLDIEILLLAKNNNCRIGLIPIVWTCGPNSRVSLKSYGQTLFDLLRISIFYRQKNK